MSPLLQILIGAGQIDVRQAQIVEQTQRTYGASIGTHLLAHHFISELTLARAISHLYGLPAVSGRQALGDADTSRTLPRSMALQLSIVPAYLCQQYVTIFTESPLDRQRNSIISNHYQRSIQQILVCEPRMWQLTHKFYLVPLPNIKIDLDDAERCVPLYPRQAETSSTTQQQNWCPSGAPPRLIPQQRLSGGALTRAPATASQPLGVLELPQHVAHDRLIDLLSS